MNRREIENTKQTVSGLCKLARQLGYKDPLYKLQNSDGTVIGDMLYFFEDNPGAIEAVIEWCADNYESEEDEDDEDDEDDEENDDEEDES